MPAPARSRRKFGNKIAAGVLVIAGALVFYLYIVNFSRLEEFPASATAVPKKVTLLATPSVTNSVKPAALTAPAATAAAPAEEGPDWLVRINFARGLVNLPPVKEDPALSAADAKHAHYLIANYGTAIRNGGDLEGNTHEEQPSRPAFSVDGASAASNSDSVYGCSSTFTGSEVIDQLMAGPFHRPAILSPRLTSVGLGTSTDGGCGAVVVRLPVPASAPTIFPQPIEFPPNGVAVSLPWASEWPEPLAACVGYHEPAGFPITLQLGRQIDGELSAHSLKDQSGHDIDHCAYDNLLYTNSDSSAQEYGRTVLKRFGTIVMIPRERLRSGTYKVSITARGQTYVWSFPVH